MIDFNVPPYVGTEEKYIKEAIQNQKICGDGAFTHRCSEWINSHFHVNYSLLTTSCTHALEMSALLAQVKEGEEVIMPSYTFVSTADAFVQRGANIVFVDIRPETMNLDERLIEDAVTARTRAIVPVHYAGVSCEMDTITDIAKARNLLVIEDAAQGFDAYYKGRSLGTIGDFGCLSFHETKNLTMGEGGAFLFQDEKWREQAEIIREKGTNRSKFFRGQIDKYTWVDYGSSYLPSDLNAAYLWAQLEQADKIQNNRMESWNFYHEALRPLAEQGYIVQPYIPPYAEHNAHMYYLKAENETVRNRLLTYFKEHGVLAVFHYIPLHNAPAGQRFGRFHGEDVYTTRESSRLLRLPLYYGLKREDQEYVIQTLYSFYQESWS